MDLDRSETGSHHDIIVGKVVNLIYIYIYYWIWPPHRIPVVNEGLGWDSLLKM